MNCLMSETSLGMVGEFRIEESLKEGVIVREVDVEVDSGGFSDLKPEMVWAERFSETLD